jgi:shikimate kinase
MRKIILTGYMAAGKTTVAQKLSHALGVLHIDLDDVIEKKAGKPIAQLFAEDGEIRFRKLEHEILKEILNSNENFILSLGGGTPCYANNHQFLQGEGVISIYLKAGIQEIVNRIKVQKKSRPLLDGLDDGEMAEFIAKHLFDRSYYYYQAKHVVNVDNKATEAIVNEIMSLY